MKISRQVKPLYFRDDESSLTIQHETEGDPFREGVSLSFSSENYPLNARVLLDAGDVQLLIAKLNEFLPR